MRSSLWIAILVLITSCSGRSEGVKWYSSNYNPGEKMDYAKGRILVPSSVPVSDLPEIRSTRPSSDSDVNTYRITFTGDLMPINGKQLTLDPLIAAQLERSNLLVVNLEGIITNEKRFLALNHDSMVLDKIRGLATKDVLINVANNHAADFGNKEFERFIALMKRKGYPVTGILDSGGIEIGPFYLYASTVWSNQSNKVVNQFDMEDGKLMNAHWSSDKVNILMPHWGYEMHRYPTIKQVDLADQWSNWDFIIGNHSHSPQPLVRSGDRLIAYSLGNLCYDHYNTNHYGGALLHLDFDLSGPEPLLISYTYQLTEQEIRNEEVYLRPVDEINYVRLRARALGSILREM